MEKMNGKALIWAYKDKVLEHMLKNGYGPKYDVYMVEKTMSILGRKIVVEIYYDWSGRTTGAEMDVIQMTNPNKIYSDEWGEDMEYYSWKDDRYMTHEMDIFDAIQMLVPYHREMRIDSVIDGTDRELPEPPENDAMVLYRHPNSSAYIGR